MAPSRALDFFDITPPDDIVEPLFTSDVRKSPDLPLLHHSLITSDFDAFRFSAASSLQLRTGPLQDPLPRSNSLISSPYNHPDHLLDLSTLNTQDSLFARALTALQPVRQDYATADYLSVFNWDRVLAVLRSLADAEGHEWKKQDFYVVIFRSQLKADADNDLLYALDQHSHAEATVSGGLLKYWFGAKNPEHRNLATCMSQTCFWTNMTLDWLANNGLGLWRSREDARNGGTGPWHAKARQAARTLYESIKFSTWRFNIPNGAREFTLEEWRDG